MLRTSSLHSVVIMVEFLCCTLSERLFHNKWNVIITKCNDVQCIMDHSLFLYPWSLVVRLYLSYIGHALQLLHLYFPPCFRLYTSLIRNEATFLNVLYLYLFFHSCTALAFVNVPAKWWKMDSRQKTRTCCRTSCPAIFLKCFLSAFFQIVDHISTQLPASFVEKLLAPDSKLLKLRFHREQQVAICFCDLVLKWHIHTHIRTDTFICTYVNAYI